MFSLQPSDLQLAPATIILLIIVAAMLQDDLTCVTVGLFASTENLSLPIAWFACFTGTLLGDLVWFAIARYCGPALATRAPLKWFIKPQHQEKARRFVDRYGALSIFLCRFLPGIRTSLQFVIGPLHRSVARAVVVFALAAFVYTLLIIGLCRAFRNTIDVLGIYKQYGQLSMVVATISVLLMIWAGKRMIESLTRRRAG